MISRPGLHRTEPGAARLWGWGWVWVLALLIVAPVLVRRGYVLRGDMVFVPDQPWKGAWLGLDGSVPRSVPGDALVSLVTQVAPGDLLQKAVLLGALVGAGLGMLRLTHGSHLVARAAACSLYIWNPYVHERLGIGHWALLCGYAALPWTVLAARRVRDGAPAGVALLVPPVAVAAWTSPSGGVLATMTALAVLLGGARVRTVVAGLGICLVLNLPWLVPGALNGGDQLGADPFGVSAFAARADTPWGVLGSLASFGGLWKESVEAAGRDVWLLSGLSIALTCAGLVGLWAARDRRTAWSLGALGAIGLLLAWLPTTGPGADVLSSLVVEVPGLGLLRDSQKWVALLALAACWGLAATADAVCRSVPGHGTFWAAALAVAPLAVMPALAWGLLGGLRPVSYPAEWEAARDALSAAVASDDGRTVVLPFSAYRRYEWNDERAVLDPAPRYFPGEVVTDDALGVVSGTVAGESRTSQRIAEALAASAADPAGLERVLDQEGVRWILVEKTTPGGSGLPLLEGVVLHDGPELRLVDRGSVTSPAETGHPRLVLATDVGVIAVVMLLALRIILARRRVYTDAGRHHRSPGGN